MDKYSEVIITSTKKYVDDLEYIAKDNKKLLKDLYQLFILNNNTLSCLISRFLYYSFQKVSVY